MPHLSPSIIETIKKGGLVAYPTEGVYGLGCDPFNKTAVERLCLLKGRDSNKGFILIAAHWSMVADLTLPIPPERLAKVQATWPGAVTWVFPASPLAPPWICGAHDSIALRITDNPTARLLCEQLNGPLVSTSANPTGTPPARDIVTVKQYFGSTLDGWVEGELGTSSGYQRNTPTPIYEAMTGHLFRE